VQRKKAVVAVESRILDALGHHGYGQLLELHDELALNGADLVQHQDLPQEQFQVLVDVGSSLVERLEGRLDHSTIARGQLGPPIRRVEASVCPVHGEAGDGLAQELAKLFPFDVAKSPVLAGRGTEQIGDAFNFASELVAQDVELLLVGDVRKSRRA